jgi:hypothetical protein
MARKPQIHYAGAVYVMVRGNAWSHILVRVGVGEADLEGFKQRVNRDISTLSSAAQRAWALSKRDVKLAGRIEELKRELFKFQTLQA